ncbi:acyl-CoA synthetase [Sneathiella aquimaris]|uniref:acyl-CoA synthetase n=1 Tax=Sneathiella aquimaris TaxID=2599305 RepID=UPI00146D3E1C|nr:acyl-CoA synthetase [Sneathiella aquimaris]
MPTPITAPFEGLKDVVAFERQAEDVWLSKNSIYEAFCQTAERFGSKTALTALPPGDPLAQGVSISFDQLLKGANQAANMFIEAGLETGETVCHLLPLSFQAFYTLIGAEAAGIVNAINPLLEPEHILGIAEAANATILVVPGSTLNEEVWQKASYVIGNLPSLKAVFVLGSGPECDGLKIFDFDEALSRQPADHVHRQEARQLDDIVGYYHTGGTTGVPKLAPHTNRMQLIQMASTGFLMGVSERDVMVAGLPLFHISGSIVSGLVPLMAGVSLVIPSPMGFRDPLVIGNYWRIVDKYRVSILGAVPTMLSALLNIPVGDADISSLRAGMTGGAAAPVEVLKAITEQTGVPMLEGYGMTEVTSFTTLQPRDGEVRFGSVGIRGPYVNVKAVILDDNGEISREADVNEIGVIVMRGTCVMPGYVQQVHNRSAFLGDGWINSGDLGRIDEDGYIWLTGRAKDLIIRSGHNIDPSLIEEALHEHPAVELAAAVGKPDSYAGEMPIAYVQFKPGATVTEDELKDFARERIAERAANPAEIHVLGEMPLTGVGKIFKPALRADATRRVFMQELSSVAGLCEGYNVHVDNHPSLGMVAQVELNDPENSVLESRIKNQLGRFTIQHQVVWKVG